MGEENKIDKRKILVLIPNFLPGYKMGGPLTSIINMIENLSDDFSFEILTSDRDLGDEKPYDNIKFNVWHKKSNYDICYLKSNFFLLLTLIRKINSSKSNIIYLNSLFNPIFSIFIVFANKIGLLKHKKIINAPRGETYDEALDFKKKKKSLYIMISKKFNFFKGIYWHASTEIEKQFIVKNLIIEPSLIRVALNLTGKRKNDENKIPIITTRNNNNDLYIVFLSRISKDKNILFTFDILKEIKAKVVFHIYGPIEDEFIWESCKNKIIDLPHNINVEYKGAIAKNKVKSTFEKYDLMFLPTFSENFGHVIVESLSVGTPVLISDNTPWRNLEEKGFGWDLSLNEPKLFINAVEYMASTSYEEKQEIKLKIQKNISSYLNNPETIELNKKLFEI